MNQNPQILDPTGTGSPLEIVTSGSTADWFENTGGSTYIPYFDSYDQLTYTSSTDLYTLTDKEGNQTTFFGFSNSSYGTFKGTFDSYQPASGSLVSVTSHDGSGRITEEQRSQTSGGSVIESLLYNYSSSGYSIGELTSATLRRSTNDGSTWTTVRQAIYSYYNTGDSFGNLDDLKTVTIEDSVGNSLSEDYYRYNTTNDTLAYEFDPAAFARLQANYSNPFITTSTDAAKYATLQVTYGSGIQVVPGAPSNSSAGAYTSFLYPVASIIDSGDGSTEGTLIGQGTTTFSYATSAAFGNAALTINPDDSGSAAQYDAYAYKATVTLPDSETDTYYMNYAGETILESQTDGSTTRYTADQYDTQSRLNLSASSLAVSSAVESSGVLTVTLNSSAGAIYTYDYFSGNTSAGATTAGNVSTYLEDQKVQLGSGGTANLIESYDYKSQTVGSTSIYYVADDTVYRNSNNSGGETTSYQYNYATGTFAPTTLVTTLPTITTAQNGPNSATVDTQYFDAYGNVTWDQDPDGHITYNAYNIATGGVTMNIQDVTLNDYSFYNTSYGSAAPFTIPSSDGMMLVTQYTVDPEGRVTEKTDPNLNVTYVVYNDSNHTTNVYPGWHQISPGGDYSTTGPVQVTHDDWSLSYDESYSYAFIAIGASAPDGSDTPGTIESLSRNLLNASGQVIEQDSYFNFAGVTFSETSVQLGSAGSNYWPTLDTYDSGGRLDRVQSPTGTITRTVYDEYGEPIATWIGTNDTNWTSSGGSSPSNMVQVSASAYDTDGNLTETVNYPGGANVSGGINGRATVNYYDFRDRLIAQMTGAVESDGVIGSPAADTSSNDTFVTFYTLDNLGEVTETDTYNAKGAASVNFSTGAILGPASGSPMVLTAASSAAYDNQGWVSASSVISVNPSNHSEGVSLSTNTYYDADGNVIATISPTGAATKYIFNGAGWNTFVYTTDGGKLNNPSNVSIGSSNAYSSATSIAHDIVLNQIQSLYDNDGNLIETINSDRFGTDAVTNGSTGNLGNASSGVFARVSYSASYYDAANRDVADINAGTFQGSSYTLPTVTAVTTASTTQLTDMSGSSSYVGDVIAILTGTGAGERTTITNYNSSSHNFSFGTITTAPDASSTFIIVDPKSLLSQTEYDAAGRPQSSIDPNGIDAQSSYDMLGRLTQSIADYTGGSPTNSTNQTTNYVYDGDNHIIVMSANMASGSQVTHYVYGVTTVQGSSLNSKDLLYQIQYPDPISGTNTSSGTYNQSEGYTYDAIGEQLTYVDRNGTTHTYGYDQLGRLTSDSVTFAGGSSVDQTINQITYGYNDAGQINALTSSHVSGLIVGVVNGVGYTYDGFGNLLADAQAHIGVYPAPTVSYTYDASNDDRLTSITYPDGRTINYNYNGSGGLDNVLSRVSSVSDSSGTLQSYSYLGLDTPVTFNSGNGVVLSYLGTVGATTGDAGDQYSGLDRFGRVVNQNWSTGSTGAGIDQFQYSYDANSNVLSKRVATNTSSGTINTTLAGMSQVYTYDGLNRLTNSSTGTMNSSGGIASPTATQGWALDAQGNWYNSSSGATTTARTNNAQNQVQTVGSATLAYDNNGNTTTDQIGQQYVYDAWNRLVKVTGPNGTVLASYSYDPEGRRITETQGVYPTATTTDLYYSNRWQVVQENVGSLVTAEHVWSPFYVDSMISTDTNPQVTTNQSNGSVDTGFGTNTSNHTTTTTLSSAVSFAKVATDGADILVATIVSTTPELLLYNASGGLDTSFGTGTGIVSLSWTNWINIAGIVVQANGKIDLAVQTSSGGMTVAQLTSAGAADTTFNSTGLLTLSSLPVAQGIVLAPNGDLLVAGVNSLSFVVAEVNPSTGAVDTSYNSSGSTSVAVASSATSFTYIGMALSPDGDLILAGLYDAGSPLSQGYLVMAAVSPAGHADTSFQNSSGFAGVVTQTWGNPINPGLSPMAITPAGDILIGDASNSGQVVLAVYEFSPNGIENSSFGSSGLAHTLVSGSSTSSVVLGIQPDGQIVIGAGTTSGAFTLVRFNSTGTLDTAFGSSGVETGASVSAGLAMITVSNGETIMIGEPASGNGIILQEFHTLAVHQTVYVEYDADYNVTSLTNSSGGVIERYRYDPYGNVTVLNAAGTTRGDGTAASSFYGWVYLHQGLRLNTATGLYDDRMRQTYDPSLGRFLQEDTTGAVYVDGPNLYQLQRGDPISHLDSTGLGNGQAIGKDIGAAVGWGAAILAAGSSDGATTLETGAIVGVFTVVGGVIGSLFDDAPVVPAGGNGQNQQPPTTIKITQTQTGQTQTTLNGPGQIIKKPDGTTIVNVGPGGSATQTIGPTKTTTIEVTTPVNPTTTPNDQNQNKTQIDPDAIYSVRSANPVCAPMI